MNLIILKLHSNQQYLDQCCDLLNDCWPRSRTARLHSLNKSNDNYPCNYLLVNLDDDRLIGHVSINLLSSNAVRRTAYIESLIIHRNYRRKGLGRYLMFELEKILVDEQFELITLRTIDQIPFYKSIGFELKYEMKSLVNGQIRKRTHESHNQQSITGQQVATSSCVNDSESKENSKNLQFKEKQIQSNSSIDQGNDDNLMRSSSTMPPIPPPLPVKNESNSHVIEYFMEKSLNKSLNKTL